VGGLKGEELKSARCEKCATAYKECREGELWGGLGTSIREGGKFQEDLSNRSLFLTQWNCKGNQTLDEQLCGTDRGEEPVEGGIVTYSRKGGDIS